MSFDAATIRKQFPILQQSVHGKPLVYLDSAATTQKPQSVIDSIQSYYQSDNANVHRGVHALSERATQAYEATRAAIKTFIGADSTEEIIFTKGATESLNLVAHSFAVSQLTTGDEILLTEMEHHSNIVPWQQVCEITGAVIKVIPVTDAGELDLSAFKTLLTPKVKILSVMQVSNAIGTVNPIQEMISAAKALGVTVVIDGTQAVQHFPVNVRELDCDFYVFSSHKMYGPTGVGVLYAKKALLNAMPPYQSGGDMIQMVSFEKTLYNRLPYKFEAGTPNIAGVIGLGKAIAFIQQIGLEVIYQYEQHLLQYAIERLDSIKGVMRIGTPKAQASALSFAIKGVHPHDVGTILDQAGVAIRAGHHCAMPLMTRFGLPGTARMSFACYNTVADIDAAMTAIESVKEVFKL